MAQSAGASDVARSFQGQNTAKNQFESAVDHYEKYHEIHGGDEEFRKSNYADLVNTYYDLITRYVEIFWGQSFHFAPRWQGETFGESIKRFEHFIALQLGLKKGMKVLDVGCGIGGPLREISRFSSTDITGLNNNAYQISTLLEKNFSVIVFLWVFFRGFTARKEFFCGFSYFSVGFRTHRKIRVSSSARGKELNFSAGLSERCNLIQGDFMNMPFPDNTFDAAYAIESTIHAPDAIGAYREIYRVLKPGQYFALDELCLTDKFDPNNARHRDLKAKIELGCGMPDVRTTRQCIQAMKEAGFEVVFARDLAEDSPCPWYQDINPRFFLWNSFSNSGLGNFLIRSIVRTLEFLRIAPKGSGKLASMLHTASHDLITSTREQIFTVTFFVLGWKPLKAGDV